MCNHKINYDYCCSFSIITLNYSYHSTLLYVYQFASVVSCPELNNLENGMIKCQSKEVKKYLYEDTCNFTCDTGYELTGSDTRTCQSDGSWSGNENICEKGWL